MSRDEQLQSQDFVDRLGAQLVLSAARVALARACRDLIAAMPSDESEPLSDEVEERVSVALALLNARARASEVAAQAELADVLDAFDGDFFRQWMGERS